MDLSVFRSRLRLRHTASLVTASFLAIAAAVFVFRRVPGKQATPPITESDLVAQVDHERCSCTCAENGELFCKVANETRRRFLSVLTSSNSSFNHSGCMISLEVPLEVQGPTATVLNCSCHESSSKGGYLCRTTFAYDSWYVQAAAWMAIAQLCVVFVALLWNAYYVVVIHLRVLPSMPLEDIDQAWMQQWLASFWDPLHSVSLWTIWCLGVATLGNPARLPGPFPDIKDFGVIGHHRNSWMPRTLDESVLLCALGVFALTGLMLLCLVLAPALAQKEAQEEEKMKEQGHRPAAEASTSKTQMCCVTSVILLAASFGLLFNPPVNFIYAVVVSVPWWLLLAKQGSTSSWPLDQPFPGASSACWDFPEADVARMAEAMKRLEFDEDLTVVAEVHTESRCMPLGATRAIRDCCQVAKEIQLAHPWRSVSGLEKRLQTLVLEKIEKSIELKSAETLQELMRAAFALGYRPPREEDEEIDEVSAPKRKRCCGRMFGYQKLTDDGGQNLLETPVRDEAWSDDLYQILCVGLSSAINVARLIEDTTSLRWLGVMVAIVYPKISLHLCGTVSCAVGTLQKHVADVEIDNHELFQVVAKATGMHTNFDGPSGNTVFSWALDLPIPQARSTIPIMLNEIPAATQDASEAAELVVVEGNPNSATVIGCRAFSLKPVILGAPALSLYDDGRWFFEIKMYGQAIPYAHHELNPLMESRIGLHLAQQKSESSNAFGEPHGLCNATSCSLRSLAGCACARGVVGCAVEKKGDSFRIWFGLNGAWSHSGTGFWDPDKPSTTCSCTSTKMNLYPAVSGRFVCEFAFRAAEFTYGPPDDSFLPLAASISNNGVGDASDRVPAAEVFGICDDDSP